MVGLQQILGDDTVGDLPLREAIIVGSGTVIRAAVAQMRHKQVGCVLIVDARGRPSGIFTERLLLNVLTQNVSLDQTAVGDFAEYRCTVLKASDPAIKVWEAIEQNGDRFIFVSDDDGKVIGLTGQRGLAEHVSECFPGEVVMQRIGGKPWMQQREGA